MLLASDIDGTIATNGNWFARWMAREAELDIPEKELAAIRYGYEFWKLSQVCMLPPEQRAALKKHAHDHHKDPDHQDNSVPIPGAREALRLLASEGATIIYTTCRQPESEERTRAWLTRYDFPCAQQVYLCQHYHWKYIYAHQQAHTQEPVILIDDLIEKMVPAFRTLAIQQREVAISLVRRLALVAIGKKELPAFKSLPFKLVALPSWRLEDLEGLTKPAQKAS
ncbi:MAG TPA: hypothetical protein VFV38_16240 [Ktedonobacteraceae bacterium]|nr:hypothetical protein [Ktedonobacteraceae bacterium]